MRTSDGGTISVHQIPDNLPVAGIKRRQDDSVVQASSALLTLQKGGSKKVCIPSTNLMKDLLYIYPCQSHESKRICVQYINWPEWKILFDNPCSKSSVLRQLI